MEYLNEIKTLLEIAAIFLTFAEYAPLLGVVVVAGFAYSLLKRKNEDRNS